MSTIQINSGVRYEREPGRNEYEPDTECEVPIVEVVIGGIRFTTDADSPAQARELVLRTARELGLDLAQQGHTPEVVTVVVPVNEAPAPRSCASCKPENDHPYRHPFVPPAVERPATCRRCGRRSSASMGCPDQCVCQECHRGKCAIDCPSNVVLTSSPTCKRWPPSGAR